jgi:hypothetical protein
MYRYEGVSKSFRTESITKYTLATIEHSLRRNIKGYGGKTYYTDSQTSDTTASSGRQLYHLQFSLQAASPETFGYTVVLQYIKVKEVIFLQSCQNLQLLSVIRIMFIHYHIVMNISA